MTRLNLIILFFLVISCSGEKSHQTSKVEKIKGFTLTGPSKGPFKNDLFSSIVSNHGNFVALIPEAIVYRQSLKVDYNFEKQWYGETKDAILDGITKARKNNLKIMIKPHLTIGWDMSNWDKPHLNENDSLSMANYVKEAFEYIGAQENKILGKGKWRGELMINSEEAWEVFEREYTTFIVEYAKIADSLNVELFCIGTELKRIALERPQFMVKLIHHIRKIYKGPITYAANWDSYSEIKFWNELDYIGVNAYFPLSNQRLPKVNELKDSWRSKSLNLSRVAKNYNKGIIFTEWGYEDEEYVAKEPWIMTTEKKKKNELMQSNAYKSMFQTVWKEQWMKGVFIWRWESNVMVKEWEMPNYSPRFNRAEKVLKDCFAKKLEDAN